MKSTIKLFIALTIFTFMLSSCGDQEEEITPQNLSGTIWRCNSIPTELNDYEIFEVRFTSTTAGATWGKLSNDVLKKIDDFEYTINDKTIIAVGEIDFSGTIENNKLSLTSDGLTINFTKQ